MKFGLVLHKIIFAYFSLPAGANQSMMQLRLCFIAFYRVLVVNDCFETLLRSADASWLVDGWRQFDVQNGSCRLFFFIYLLSFFFTRLNDGNCYKTDTRLNVAFHLSNFYLPAFNQLQWLSSIPPAPPPSLREVERIRSVIQYFEVIENLLKLLD